MKEVRIYKSAWKAVQLMLLCSAFRRAQRLFAGAVS